MAYHTIYHYSFFVDSPWLGVRELCWNNFGNNDGAKESRTDSGGTRSDWCHSHSGGTTFFCIFFEGRGVGHRETTVNLALPASLLVASLQSQNNKKISHELAFKFAIDRSAYTVATCRSGLEEKEVGAASHLHPCFC